MHLIKYVFSKERGGEKLAQINHTYTIARIACASLTVKAISSQDSSTPWHAQCTEGDPLEASVHEKLPPTHPQGSISSSAKARERTKDNRSPSALWNRETGRKEHAFWPRAALPCRVSREGAPTRGGCCWGMLASVPHNTSFTSLKHRLRCSPTAESPASPHTSVPCLSFLRCRKLLGEASPQNMLGSEAPPPQNDHHYFSNNYAITKK